MLVILAARIQWTMLKRCKKLCINYMLQFAYPPRRAFFPSSLIFFFHSSLIYRRLRVANLRCKFCINYIIHSKLREFLIDRNFHAAIPLAIYHTARSFEITKLLEDPSRIRNGRIISSAL